MSAQVGRPHISRGTREFLGYCPTAFDCRGVCAEVAEGIAGGSHAGDGSSPKRGLMGRHKKEECKEQADEVKGQVS